MTTTEQTALLIRVPGHNPAPQGSKSPKGNRISKNGKLTPILVESCLRVGPWRDAVATYTRQAVARYRIPPMDGALRIEIVFTMQPAPGIPREEWATRWPNTRYYGDVDKLVRSTFDAVSVGPTGGGAVVDDARFVDVRAIKLFPGHPGSLPTPGAIIRITQIAPPHPSLLTKSKPTRKKAAR